VLNTRIAISLLALGLLIPNFAIALTPAPAKTSVKEAGATFASTKFSGNELFGTGMFDETGQPNIRVQAAASITLKNCNTNADVTTAFAKVLAPSLDGLGLVPVTEKEIQAARKMRGVNAGPLTMMLGDHSLVYSPKDGESLQKWVNKIDWLGTRENGPISGVVSKLYFVVVPFDISFGDNEAVFEPMVQVFGSWHSLHGVTDTSSSISYAHFNANALVASLLTGFKQVPAN